MNQFECKDCLYYVYGHGYECRRYPKAEKSNGNGCGEYRNKETFETIILILLRERIKTR